jgi:hypothetical protein
MTVCASGFSRDLENRSTIRIRFRKIQENFFNEKSPPQSFPSLTRPGPRFIYHPSDRKRSPVRVKTQKEREKYADRTRKSERWMGAVDAKPPSGAEADRAGDIFSVYMISGLI